MRTVLLTLTTCLLVLPAHAKYSGGSGTAQDPYQIATAADLILLGETPEDYDKHFILTADIDLDPHLPGRKVFDRAVIAPDADPIKSDFQGTFFNGVFDGNSHRISHLTVKGMGYLGLFGQLQSKAQVQNLGLVDVNASGTGMYVSGLVGQNLGAVTHCFSTGVVSGTSFVGGLVGANGGTVTQCYSTGQISGSSYVGGLAGYNGEGGVVSQCYSTDAVSGSDFVGGLVGYNYHGVVTHCYSTGTVSNEGWNWYVGGLVGFGSATACFWDTQTSGQATSEGGTGKTTAKMQTAGTYLDAGWDFVAETANGTEDIWWILEGKDYPHLWWEGATK